MHHIAALKIISKHSDSGVALETVPGNFSVGYWSPGQLWLVPPGDVESYFIGEKGYYDPCLELNCPRLEDAVRAAEMVWNTPVGHRAVALDRATRTASQRDR